MPRFDADGKVVFKGDDPGYLPDYGMAGKGNWLLVGVESGKNDGPDLNRLAFGPFPSDEDAIEFGHAMLDPDRFCWTVGELTDPRDLAAMGQKLAELGLVKVSVVRREHPEGEES